MCKVIAACASHPVAWRWTIIKPIPKKTNPTFISHHLPISLQFTLQSRWLIFSWLATSLMSASLDLGIDSIMSIWCWIFSKISGLRCLSAELYSRHLKTSPLPSTVFRVVLSFYPFLTLNFLHLLQHWLPMPSQNVHLRLFRFLVSFRDTHIIIELDKGQRLYIVATNSYPRALIYSYTCHFLADDFTIELGTIVVDLPIAMQEFQASLSTVEEWCNSTGLAFIPLRLYLSVLVQPLLSSVQTNVTQLYQCVDALVGSLARLNILASGSRMTSLEVDMLAPSKLSDEALRAISHI